MSGRTLVGASASCDEIPHDIDRRLVLAGGRYEVGALLGRGGAGEVYRGFDHTLRRQIAIKMLVGGETYLRQSARSEREVQLLARLQHSNLIALYDTGYDGRRQYLVMPLVEGTTLAGRIDSGTISGGEAERIGLALTQALAYIHARDIVHRDIKPSNVLIGRDGRTFLADFGIARSDENDRTLTSPGLLMGTAAYLAPEQVQDRQSGCAADVYALGLVLLEALTGTRAFQGTNPMEVALARLLRQPEIPDSLGAGWVRLLAAMTARDPAYRPDPTSITDTLSRRLQDPPERIAPAPPSHSRPAGAQPDVRPSDPRPIRRYRMMRSRPPAHRVAPPGAPDGEPSRATGTLDRRDLAAYRAAPSRRCRRGMT